MSAPFNNTNATDAPQTSQPLGAPLTGSTHSGTTTTSTNNPFTDSHASTNPVASHGHDNSHPSAALTGAHTGIGGAHTGQGNLGANAPHSNTSHQHDSRDQHQGGDRKEGLMDALNPKTSGGTHLPSKGDSNTHDNTHSSHDNSHSHAQQNPSSIAHGQQTGNTIHGAGVAPGANQAGFQEKTASGFTESAHSSNTATHTNVDANTHDHDRTPNVADRVSGQEAGGLAPRADHDPKSHATPGLGKDLGGDSYHDQPGSAHASSHRDRVDPRDVDATIGSKNDIPTASSGGGPVSVGGGMGTGDNRTIPGGVKGTGGMGKRDGEDAMGGGGGIIGKLSSKLGLGHGNTKTTGEHDSTTGAHDTSRTH